MHTWYKYEIHFHQTLKVNLEVLTRLIKIVGINVVKILLYAILLNLMAILMEFFPVFINSGVSILYSLTFSDPVKLRLLLLSLTKLPSVPYVAISMKQT